MARAWLSVFADWDHTAGTADSASDDADESPGGGHDVDSLSVGVLLGIQCEF